MPQWISELLWTSDFYVLSSPYVSHPNILAVTFEASAHCSYSTLVLLCMWRGWEQIIYVFSAQVISQTEKSCTQGVDPEDLYLPELITFGSDLNTAVCLASHHEKFRNQQTI